MTTPLVLLGLALLAGAVVWVLSVRQTRPPGSSSWETSRPEPARQRQQGFDLTAEEPDAEPPVATPHPAAESFAYLPLAASDGLDLRTRLLGIAGLIALIVLTSAAVAAGVWMLGHAIGLQLSHFASSG